MTPFPTVCIGRLARKWAVCLLCWGLCGSSLWAREVPITVVHTTDLHGRILPAEDYDGTPGVGGLLRCATLIESFREANPGMLLVDCGDLYQGSIESFRTQGRIMNRALEWLGYDAWVVGNHEFDWGMDVLSAAIAHSSVPVLAANLGVRPGGVNPLPAVQPYVMQMVDGVRVALVGVTTDAIPTWSRPDLLQDVVVEDSVEALRRVLPLVRAEEPDVMVLLLHQGYRAFGDSPANQVNRIARHFPEFDLILGGHSHQPVEQVHVNGTLYAQAGYYGIWVGKVELMYDTVAREITSASSSLYEVADAYPEHAALRETLSDELDRALEEADTEIGQAARTLETRSRSPGQSAIQQLFGHAIADAVSVDVVLHGTLSDHGLEAGPVRVRDVWRIAPYANTIGVVMITPAELAGILEENAALLGSSRFMGVYGIQYEWHEYAPSGEQIRNIRYPDGSPVHPRKRLRVALNSYVLASGGGRFPTIRRMADQPLSRLTITDIQTRDAIIDYFKDHSPVDSVPVDGMQRIRSRD